MFNCYFLSVCSKAWHCNTKSWWKKSEVLVTSKLLRGLVQLWFLCLYVCTTTINRKCTNCPLHTLNSTSKSPVILRALPQPRICPTWFLWQSLEFGETYFTSVVSGGWGGTAVQTDSWRVGSGLPVAALLTLADLLLIRELKVSGFGPKATLRSSAARRVREHRLIVWHLQLLQLLIDLLQVRNSWSHWLSLHLAQLST